MSRAHLIAYAADTGRRLGRSMRTTGILAQPISYMAGGRQYVTVLTGWRMTGTSGPGLDWDYRTQHRRVLTFAIGGTAAVAAADRTPPPFVDDASFRIDAARAQQGAAMYRAALRALPWRLSGRWRRRARSAALHHPARQREHDSGVA